MGAIAGALTTVQLQAVARGGLAPLPLEELQQLAAVFGMVKSDYVEPVDEKKLITDAISGMVSSLDPHSVYFDKKSYKEFREGTSGRFVGVGIEISQEDGLVKVVSPIEGSPADRAGLKPNDLITRIDDTAVKGLSLNEAVKKMRGEPKTKVSLTIFRKDESRTFPVTIIREEIRTQSVRGKVIEPGYAWVRLSQFQDRTVDDFVIKVDQIYKQEPNLKGLVLDLRNEETIFAVNRFMIYALFPETNISIHAMWGVQKQNTVFATGKSITNRTSKTNIGELMLSYGGGGHENAGTCQISNDQADTVLKELISKIMADG